MVGLGPSGAFPPEPPTDCRLCPRLVDFRDSNADQHPDWFNAPVPSFGNNDAQFLIVGLAPGLQGANKTGRPFTGDYAGDLLYETLSQFEFSKGTYLSRADDGLSLVNAMITNAVRCVPPQNKPTGPEANNCRPFLVSRIQSLDHLKVILALGKIAHDAVIRAFSGKLSQYKFAHGAKHALPKSKAVLFDSYHCSRYNTNTGRLTREMFFSVFTDIKSYIEDPVEH
ncbi:MAG: uracil-DNA glycosylase [Pseudomonadota bacterium]